MRLFLFLLCATVAPAAAQETRTAAVSLALADVRKLPVDRQQYAFYLWRPRPAGDAKEVAAALALKARLSGTWVHFLSTEPDLAPAAVVGPNLLRVFVDDYGGGWKKARENLLNAEPWFHADTVVVKVVAEDVYRDYGYYDARGKFRATEKRLTRKAVKKAVKVRAAAFADPAEYAQLIALTQSQVPIVRADWLLFQTAIQEGREGHGYYDFLGLGQKRQDWDNLVGANIQTSRKLRKAHRAIIGRSTVTLNNRGMEGGATLTEGIRMLTDDFAASQDVKNPLRLLQEDARRDGGEGLGNMPNGLLAAWVENAQGNRLNAVPDNIASDKTSRSPDRRVHAGQCWRCHEEGYKPVDDWARRIYAPPFSLDSPDARLQRELRAAYLSDLKGFIKRGNDVYLAALQKLDWKTTREWSQAFADEWSEYADQDRTADDIARELGVDPKKFAAGLRAYLAAEKAAGRLPDPVIAGLVQGIPARIEHVEELVPLLSQIAEGK